MEAGARHSAFGFLIFHEVLPHETCPGILRHQQRDARVDPENILVIPIRQRVKRIDKAEFSPGLLSVFFAD